MTPVIRAAAAVDAPSINDIHNHYVVHSTATFITTPVTLEDRLDWLTDRQPLHPVIVADAGGGVVGWAALSPFRPREAYRRTVEFGVYVRPDSHRLGVGRALVAELIARARLDVIFLQLVLSR